MQATRISARPLLILLAVLCIMAWLAAPAQTQQAEYVGSDVCGDCHPDEYENYKTYSKKAHSGESVQMMADDLTEEEMSECFHCHTTGYGQPGGFVSYDETPDRANAGCEVCHGPGSEHVDGFGDPDYIKGDLNIKDCEHCHNPDRVAAFDYKPLIFGGAH